MNLFITAGYAGRIISARQFNESQPITPVEALKLWRSSRDVRLSHTEHADIVRYLLACAG